MEKHTLEYKGLTAEEVGARQTMYGKNEQGYQKKHSFLHKALSILREPMFLLLLTASAVYFILGEPRDGCVMMAFVAFIIGIDIWQEWKTDKSLRALNELCAPHITVVRGGQEQKINSAELVPGDIMIIREGVKIPADGVVLRCSDLLVDESTLTGEAVGVYKAPAEDAGDSPRGAAGEDGGYWRKDYCYAGTLVTQGFGVIRVEKTGASTEYGKIGKNIMEAPEERTPLQKQTGSLVRLCAGIAAALFILVGAATWLNLPNHAPWARLVESVLSGITLSMAMIPEEFPVILAVFLSMGAWRLSKKRALVRRLPSVETLGAVSVLCVDKTGTITMNRMTVQETWAADGDEQHFCEMMGLACETIAYDPMEKAMLAYCEARGIYKSHLFGGELITEFAFTNELKMMGHVWHHDGEIIIAAKGSPEQIFNLCGLTDAELETAEQKTREMSEQGLRVIAVAATELVEGEDIPADLTGCAVTLHGLVGLEDPPRESVKTDIAVCARAGIRVVMITGDGSITAQSIAKQIGMRGNEVVTGDMIDGMTDTELCERVKTTNIFSRVIPAHKMRIVRAFAQNGDIVAMTGDGVNDAPALRHADIGIAMGMRGSEVSREAADIILMDDNFSTIVDTVKDGRRIYDNIRRAVGYVFAIHIPIAAISLVAPMLGIAPASLMLLPLHVVLMELIIDPTCSVVLERQPAEMNIMERGPRDPHERLLNMATLVKSVLQGLAIFAVAFGAYLYTLKNGSDNAAAARAMGLAVLMLASLLLVQVNSSDTDSVFVSARRLFRDKVMWAASLLTVAGLLIMLYTPLSGFLRLAPLSWGQLLLTPLLAGASVLWYEGVKLMKRRRARHDKV